MLRSRFWQTAAALGILFLIVADLTRTAAFTEGLRYIELFFSVAVTIGFVMEAWSASLHRRQSASDYLTLGIFVSWGGTAVQAVWLLLWRIGGQPAWMVNNDFNASFFAVQAFAAALHLMSTKAINDEVPKRRTVFIALLASAGLIATMLTIGASPRVDAFLEWLHPWVASPMPGPG